MADTATHPARSATSVDPGTPSLARPARRWWTMMILGGLLGIVSGVWQTVDRIAYAAGGKAEGSVCEINAVLSCSSVYSYWQSSALGIPNTLIGVPVFALIASAGLAGLLGSQHSRAYLATILGLTVFMAGFITWYMAQSGLVIGILCLFCAACMIAIIVAGVGITRVAAVHQALGTGRAGRELRIITAAGADLIAWAGLGLVVAAMLYLGLRY